MTLPATAPYHMNRGQKQPYNRPLFAYLALLMIKGYIRVFLLLSKVV